MTKKRVIKLDTLPKLARKTRVAAYARVSVGKDSMLHSLAAQVSYYKRIIQDNSNWEFIGVYADEGMTGTKDSRDEFQALLKDCRAGKIDMVITKSISRFARNAVTLLETVRELKSIGVDVFFEEQNIHTLSSDGELILTILASYAQEESRQVSENMKWRIKNNFKEGIPWNVVLYGYTYEDGKFKVIITEAKVIKLIYELFMSGLGVVLIANKLNEEGYRTRKKRKWSKSSVRFILSNYNYTGNLLLQKTFRENHITKRRIYNNGELPRYHAEGSHEAIVSIDEYIQVQEELKIRDNLYKKAKAVANPFTGIINCDRCGTNYRRKTRHPKFVWQCGNYLDKGKASCNAKQVPEDILYELICDVIELKEFNEDVFKSKVKSIRVCENNILVFKLANGTDVTKEWKYKSRSESWNPEMREKARRRSLNQWQEK